MDLAAADHVTRSVPIATVKDVDAATWTALQLARTLPLSESDLSRVEQVVTQATLNVIQHATRGELLLRSSAPEGTGTLEILALDRGPGMVNVARAMRDGFSTTGASGLGLGSMSRLASFFDITSTPGKGTAILARVTAQTSSAGPVAAPGVEKKGLEWGVVCVALRGEEQCGDVWTVLSGDERDSVLLVDGLGHGPLACEAAARALRAFADQGAERPEPSLRVLHEALRETRGAVAAVARIDWRRRQVVYAGAGNISGTLVRRATPTSNLVSHNGTLGRSVTRFQEFAYPWPEGGLMVLHSDGLSAYWDLEPYPGLTRKDPALIAAVLYRDFASRRDDVVVLVGRERQPQRAEEGAAA